MEETLFTAARRVLREFNICNERDGGLIGIELQKAILTLEKQIEAERAREKAKAS